MNINTDLIFTPVAFKKKGKPMLGKLHQEISRRILKVGWLVETRKIIHSQIIFFNQNNANTTTNK